MIFAHVQIASFLFSFWQVLNVYRTTFLDALLTPCRRILQRSRCSGLLCV